MENLFGITEEEIENFVADAPKVDADSIRANFATKQDLTVFLKDPEWLPMAKKIGVLPGLQNDVKCAAILAGPGLILSTLMILHLPTLKEIDLAVGIHMFVAYMKVLAYSEMETQAWVSLYYLMGAVQNYPIEDAHLTDNAEVLNMLFLPNSKILWANMIMFKPKLEAMGIEFTEDFEVLADMMDDLAVDIEDLAP